MRKWILCEPAAGVVLRLTAGAEGICGIDLEPRGEPEWPRDDGHALLREAASQLTAYFDGTRYRFDLPLEVNGTDFQIRVWGELRKIPYGETRSYRAIAEGGGGSARGARRGRRQRPQPHSDRGPLPPRDRRGRQPGGLRRRAAAEEAPARDSKSQHAERFRKAATR